MFYDVHTHALHPKIAPKVLAQLQSHYGIVPVGDGLIGDLLARARRARIDRVVVHTAATAPGQVIPANNWALELGRRHPEVIAFGTLHPGYADWEKELGRLRQAGVPGLKFHPEFQDFWMDDPRLLPILEAAHKDFIILFHVGDRPAPQDNPSCPFKLAAILDAFPQARIIAPHLGGYLHWKWVLETLVGRRVYLDTSSALSFIDDATLREIFRRHPRELILFGSDYPLFDPSAEAVLLQSRLKLSDAELEEILGNGAQLFG